MMVKNKEIEGFLDFIRPDFAHVMVVAGIEEMNAIDGDPGDFCLNSGKRLVVAVAVRATNIAAVNAARCGGSEIGLPVMYACKAAKCDIFWIHGNLSLENSISAATNSVARKLKTTFIL